MQKALSLLSFFLISFTPFSVTHAEITEAETITHKIIPDRLIKSGKIQITLAPHNTEKLMGTIKYNIVSKFWGRQFNGEIKQELPKKFEEEEGYRELEDVRVLEFEEGTITHLGREDVKRYKDCHKIKVVPKPGEATKHADWEAIAYYHPSIGSIGWVKTIVTLKKVPYVGQHTATSVLKMPKEH